MKTNLTRVVVAGFVFVAMALLTAHSTSAQCATCPSPTIAYQPVAVQPTTVYQPVATSPRRGWYPGKYFDQMRLRYYGAPTATPTYANYTASYAPSYAPYTAGYAPYASPYVTAYAPLARTVVARPLVQTSYYAPQVAPSHCSSCVQTVARPVILSPVITTGCSVCSTVPTGVSQAAFTEPGCSSCATTPATIGSGTRPLPRPSLIPDEPVPAQSNYPQGSGHSHDEKSVLEQDDFNLDSSPSLEADPDQSSTSLDAPKLLDLHDRTARRSSGPTVDVWNAVYHKSTTGKVKQTSHKPTQAEIDAEGWHAVPQGR